MKLDATEGMLSTVSIVLRLHVRLTDRLLLVGIITCQQEGLYKRVRKISSYVFPAGKLSSLAAEISNDVGITNEIQH
jgi:hypothetical protein